MRERALREEDRVNGGADDRGDGDARVPYALGEPEEAGEREGGDGEHRYARDRDVKAEELPSEREVGHDERRVRVRERRVRDERAVRVYVSRGRDEVARLVPVVWKLYERQVRNDERREDREEDEGRAQSSQERRARAVRACRARGSVPGV